MILKLNLMTSQMISKIAKGEKISEEEIKEITDLQKKFEIIKLSYFQSNIEGEIIDMLHDARKEFDGVILNAAAYTHTSVAIADAIKAIETPVVEVHISNTHARESFRHKSYLSPVVKGVILGFGLKSYDLAIQSFL